MSGANVRTWCQGLMSGPGVRGWDQGVTSRREECHHPPPSTLHYTLLKFPYCVTALCNTVTTVEGCDQVTRVTRTSSPNIRPAATRGQGTRLTLKHVMLDRNSSIPLREKSITHKKSTVMNLLVSKDSLPDIHS